jgi:hypothetical protein
MILPLAIYKSIRFALANGQNRGKYPKTKGKITRTCDQRQNHKVKKNESKHAIAFQSRGMMSSQ